MGARRRSTPTPFDAAFSAALREIEGIDGWLRRDQAWRLWTTAGRAGPGALIVEIGSYRGRSTVVLARAMHESAELLAIDPHAGTETSPRFLRHAQDGEADHDCFHANLARAGVADRVRHVRAPSTEAINGFVDQVDVLYVDGSHRRRDAAHDLSRWGGRLRPGGTLLVHDAFNSAVVTLVLLRRMSFTRDFRYVGRERSLAEYRRVPVSIRGRARNLVLHIGSIPWFLRNVAIKALRAARLDGVARVLAYKGDGTY